MQIRELDLKELETAWSLLTQLKPALTYNEFEDLIYEMRDINYTMLGIFEQERLVTYAGVAISTNLSYKRHLFIYEFVTDKEYRKHGYAKMMLDYIVDYAKMGACKNIVASSELKEREVHKFYEKKEFIKKSITCVRAV